LTEHALAAYTLTNYLNGIFGGFWSVSIAAPGGPAMLPFGDALPRNRNQKPTLIIGLFITFAAIFFAAGIARADGQSPQTNDSTAPKFAFYFASLTDPACPVTVYAPHAPVTKEIHVLYYPMATQASIKEPKSLLLHLVLGHQIMPFDEQKIQFTQRDDGVWLASYTYKEFAAAQYAIYWAEDPETKRADTNAGQYFEVPFCDLHGKLLEANVQLQARSHTGILEAQGIERPVNYAKAIEILEDYIRIPPRGRDLVGDLWTYKLELRGDTPETRVSLLNEIDKFIGDHTADGFGLLGTLTFISTQDWIPGATADKLARAMRHSDPDVDVREFLLQAKAGREPDSEKHIALLRELLKEFPSSQFANNARMELLAALTDLGEREKVYEEIRATTPDLLTINVHMARIYLDANEKLPRALILLDEADRELDANAQNHKAPFHYGEEQTKFWKGRIVVTRADILVRQGKPAEALAILEPRKDEFKLGWSFYVYGRALEGTGDQRAAVEAYLQSVVRISQYQEDANSRLEKLWREQKLGTKKDLQQRVDALSVQTFTNYRPQVLRHVAPEFELTTLSGEKLNSAQLRGKKIILNFWAVWCGPCRAELKGLEQFQADHSELVVLTAVDAAADSKDLRDLIREQGLKSLRIAPAPKRLMERFGAFGFPNTFIIDEKGFVRIEQLGGGPGIAHDLVAGLEAIRGAGVQESAQNDRK
jgi:thiol-disulfide isomerase/thioredoxin